MKQKIERWYLLGLWTESMVRAAVDKGVLTQAEAQKILGGENHE